MATAASEKLSQHGVMLIWQTKGILITGDAGIGKSSLALELISQGAILIADDVVDITRKHTTLFATCPAFSRGLLHTRELGLLNIHSLFGEQACQNSGELDATVTLATQTPQPVQFEHPLQTEIFLGLTRPCITLSTHSPASLSVRIETWLRQHF